MDEWSDVPKHEARAGFRGEDRSLIAQWDEAAPWMAGLAPLAVLGFAAFLVGMFLHQIWTSGGQTSDGLADTSGWFLWIGRAAVGSAFILASFRPSPAHAPVRVALAALGTLVLMGTGWLGGPQLG